MDEAALLCRHRTRYRTRFGDTATLRSQMRRCIPAIALGRDCFQRLLQMHRIEINVLEFL
jgi:hypothetical protein